MCKPERRLVVATFEKTRDILKTADKETNFFNRKKETKYHMSKLRDIMDQDKEQSCSNVMKYHQKYKQLFDEKKKFLIDQMEAELKSLSDANAITGEIEKYKRREDTLSVLKRQYFDVIDFDIDGRKK